MASITQKGDVNVEVLFENLPDWAIPMMHIVPIFYTLNAYDINDLNFVYDFNYIWEKVEQQNGFSINNDYILKIRISAQIVELFLALPLYVNLKCYFLNDK